MLLYLAIPPAVGFTSASWFLTDKTAVPWVLLTAMVLGTVSFLLAGPLGRRSRHFALAGYRRAAELSVLVGLTCVAVVAYTAGIYLLLGFDEPWADQLISAFLGG